jgi:type VI secretion system protein VasG
MEDGEGRRIDFRNTLILLTSNAGSDLIMDLCAGPGPLPAPEELAAALREPLLRVFPAALLGRLVTVPYYPLSDKMIADITRLQLGRIERRVMEEHGVPFLYSDRVVETIVSRCQELESGGRMVDAIVTNTLLPEISGELLRRTIERRAVAKIEIDVEGGEFTYAFE